MRKKTSVPTHHPGLSLRRLGLVPALALAAFLVGACSDSSTNWEPRGSSMVTLSFQNLPPLDGGLNYQAWAVEFRNGAYWGSPMGIFNLDESGQIVDPATGAVLSGEFEASLNAEEVYGVQVTVEDSEVLVIQPSGTYILGGTMVNGLANLGQESWLSQATDFSSITGRYFLATPSNDLEDDELSGVWFADYNGGDPRQGLNLPQAPTGWDYEGWVIFGDDTVSTGKFYFPGIADTLNLYGGLTGNLPYPGQDFIKDPPAGLTFPTNLSGLPILVTMELADTFDVAPSSPFFFGLLEAQIPLDAEPDTNYDMTSLFDVFPRGTASVVFQ